MLVRHLDQPQWGLGQVQSSLPGRVTVMFEHAGKVVLDPAKVRLSVVKNM